MNAEKALLLGMHENVGERRASGRERESGIKCFGSIFGSISIIGKIYSIVLYIYIYSTFFGI